MKYFLFITVDDVEPNIKGPFDTPDKRTAFAKAFRDKEGPGHGVFALDIDANGVPDTWAYPGAFFDDDKQKEVRKMPEWICRECGKKAYGWGPKYENKDCPHCGGELAQMGKMDISEGAGTDEKIKTE